MPSITPYILIPAITLIIAQIIKFAVYSYSNEIDFKQLLKIGGVPSAHIAALSALVATSLAVDGVNSSVFGVTTLLVAVIIWEELTLKAKLTRQIKALQASTKLAEVEDLPDRSNTAIGLGMAAGFIAGIALAVEYWKDDVSWLFDRPSDSQMFAAYVIFGLIALIGEFLSYLTRRKDMRRLPTSSKLRRSFRIGLTAPALTGLVITFAQQQTLGLFGDRIWTLLVFVWIGAAFAWSWRSVYRSARKHLEEEKDHFKKSKARDKSKRKKGSKKKRK